MNKASANSVRPEYIMESREDVIYHDNGVETEPELFIAEPILMMQKLPQEYYKGWEQELYGSRVYWAGTEICPEFDLGIEFKFMQLGPVFMGEGSWPCPPAYLSHTKSASFSGDTDTWCGTLRYRTRLRDSIYLGLIHRTPLILTWDEQIGEDERIVFEKVRWAVDWSRKFIQPDVSIIVDNSVVTGEGRRNLAEYEKVFTAMPLNYRYLLPGLPEANCNGAVIDGRLPFSRPGFHSEGGVLPDTLKDMIPVKVSEGYSCSYL